MIALLVSSSISYAKEFDGNNDCLYADADKISLILKYPNSDFGCVCKEKGRCKWMIVFD